jgi:hypothetical protein
MRHLLAGLAVAAFCTAGLAAEELDFKAMSLQEAERIGKAAQEKSIAPAFAKLWAEEAAFVKALAADPAYLEATGEVEQVAAPQDGEGVGGIIKPLALGADRHSYMNRTLVWHVPAGAGVAAIQGRKFTYTVQMAHQRGGQAGAFFYVAYADTNGDGNPDRFIARSPVAQAAKAGGWTSWSFASDEHVVFVGVAWIGETWPIMSQHVSLREQRMSDNWKGLGVQCLGTSLFCGLPIASDIEWTNLRVSVKQ